MRNTVLALFAFAGTLFATNPSYSQTMKVTMKSNNMTVGKVINEIEKQTDYLFVYDESEVNMKRNVKVNAQNTPVAEVLKELFEGTGIYYAMEGKNIMLMGKVNAPQAVQQANKITGVVTDVNGEPIIGANVVAVGIPGLGSITNLDGEFSLTIPYDCKLHVSYIGYTDTEVSTKGKSNIKIVLKEDTKVLDEVVVVGYGTQKKVNLTGAVETVKSEKIASKPVTSVAEALTGEAAGVTVIQRSSKPGAYDTSIRIRGVGTWANANPLVLVDGIELGMDKVNPSDIENITVLKDAAASAIYGSRAGNGVILITTKRGTENSKPQINFSTNWGVQVTTRMLNKQDALTYTEKYDKRLTNNGQSGKYTDLTAKMKAGEWDPEHGLANTDWMDEILRPALQQNHNVSVNGGNKTTSYLASLGYLNQASVVGDNTSFERYNARLNTHSKITSWLNVDFNMSYMTSQSKEPQPGVTNIVKHAMEIEPYTPVQFADGTYTYSGIAANPVRLAFTDDYGTSKSTRENFNGLLSGEISLFGFKWKNTFAYERQISRSSSFAKTVSYNAYTPAGETKPSQTEHTTVAENSKSESFNGVTNITANSTLTYENTFGKHYLKVLLGASRELLKTESLSGSKSVFPNNDLDDLSAGTKKASTSGGTAREALASYFGRLNYVFNDRYLAEFTIRKDGSSKFAPGHRWGTFPSASIGWRISEEKFYKPLKKYVESLKLRSSWGKLGNNRISDYQYLSMVGINNNNGYIFGGNNMSGGFYESSMGNPSITWENLESVNIGADIALLNNRLDITAEWFNRRTKDILLQLPAPSTLGISPSTSNAAEVENKGWELTINWRDQIKDFKYNISFNLSDVRNKVVDLKGYKAPTNALTILREGEPINALFGWEAIGICRTQEDYERYKDQMSSISNKFAIGDIIYKDIDGNGTVNGDDKKVIGNQIPRYTFGLRLGMEWKNFDFSCFFQGVAKCDGYLTYEAQNSLYDTSNSFEPTTNMQAKYPRLMPDSHYTYTSYSSLWVQDASYVRLKNITLGYTFKQLNKYGISNLRAFLTGENVATITGYDGFDPESPIGMRGWMYPLVGVYSFGLSLTF